MKTFASILISLSALSAYACPDLSGTYNYSPDGSITLNVTQVACSQITFVLGVEGTNSTEVDKIDGTPQGQTNGTANTFQFQGDTLVVTPVDATGKVIPGSYSTYSLTSSKDMQYSIDIATDTANPYNDVSIFKRVSN
jgi:hypothetical protein